ncbi:MAG: hypothetical protein QS748_02760 [Candidatus Endonucleobacter bathymodioli]|uniref:Uncharacterized protein n=1 Tax=Candidatus Endonucleibacter bathymodioli TaxID=539814 RepID=A0AA90NTY3_9GAMM|nr:hypothetical protein [Candidatus Endonucleobacter bathymodioli]
MEDAMRGIGGQPVNYSLPSVVKSGEDKEVVGAGLIGSDTKLQMMKKEENAIIHQLEHRPTLMEPKEMGMQAQAAANQVASKDLAGLGAAVESASQETAVTMVRVQLGIQTPQDQEVLQRNTAVLSGASNYIDSLFKDKGKLTEEDKAALLGGQGFDDQKIKNLLRSQSDPGAFQASVKEKHGDAYTQRKADLVGMGYDNDQADIVLSLSDDRLMGDDLSKSQLKKLFNNNPEAKQLVDIGFDENKIKELLSLVNKGVMPKGSLAGSENMIKLLGRMGFDEKTAKILLSTGSPDKLKEQLSLLNRLEGYPNVSKKLLSLAQSAQRMSDSPNKAFLEESLKQQADIFVVLSLIHQMSVQQRRYAREARSAEYDSAKQSVLNQVEHIKKAAVLTLVADVVQGSMSIAGGALSMKAGASGVKIKGPKGKGSNSAASTKIDDVEVRSSAQGAKNSGKTSSKDDVDGSSSGKKKTSKKNADSDDNAAQTRLKSTNKKTEAKTQDKQQSEKDANASAKKKSEEKLDSQQDEIQQSEQNKKEVTIDQDKHAEQQKAADLDSTKQQKRQMDMGRRQGQAMAANSIFTGTGQAVGGLFKFAAADEAAEQKKDEAIQKTHENAAQSWNEWMQLQQDQVKNCQTKIDEISRIHFDNLKNLSRG